MFITRSSQKKAYQQLAQPKKKQRRQQRQLSNINSSYVPLSVITAPTTLSTTQTARITNKLSLLEHKAHVQKLINKWCSENKDDLGLENFNLEENDDFF